MTDTPTAATSRGVVLSLFDRSGVMARPWAEAGYECICVDIQHEGTTEEQVGDGIIYYVERDIKEYLPPRTDFEIAFAFPPCTNLAVSGARWFEQKGIDGLADGLQLVERAKKLLTWTGAPWMLENPVSTISSYWREPNHTFHPYEFDPYTDEDEAYRKKTCLWTGNGFDMPEPHPEAPDDGDDRIHKMGPSEDRADKRAQTPLGFARAVFETNTRKNSSSVGSPDINRRKDTSSVAVSGGANKRDEVWMAVISQFQTESRIRVNDVSGKVRASDKSVRNVLSAMHSAQLVNHEHGSPYWDRGPVLSKILGHPAPTGGVRGGE